MTPIAELARPKLFINEVYVFALGSVFPQYEEKNIRTTYNGLKVNTTNQSMNNTTCISSALRPSSSTFKEENANMPMWHANEADD